MFFQKIIQPEKLPPITNEIASQCYSLMKLKWDTAYAYEWSNIPYQYFLDVFKEANRIYSIVLEKMNSENRPNSKEELRSFISSDMLDCDIVLTDCIDYILDYKENTTREDFISQFNI